MTTNQTLIDTTEAPTEEESEPKISTITRIRAWGSRNKKSLQGAGLFAAGALAAAAVLAKINDSDDSEDEDDEVDEDEILAADTE